MSTPLYFNSYTTNGRALSNFYVAPLKIELTKGVFWFYSAEAAYQCLKQPRLTKKAILPFQLATPGAARQYGKTVELRADWDEKKQDAMRFVLRAKFEEPTLRKYLIETGVRPLVHLSPWDRFWGVDSNGVGQNVLGVLLMDLRNELSGAGVQR